MCMYNINIIVVVVVVVRDRERANNIMLLCNTLFPAGTMDRSNQVHVRYVCVCVCVCFIGGGGGRTQD